jgi:hypothetical protein
MAKKNNPSMYFVYDYHDSPNHENLRKDMRQGHVWSEFGPNNLEGTHGKDNDVSHNVAKIDARVVDLVRAAKLGRPTSVSGANIAKMGDMRVPSNTEGMGAGVELEHKRSYMHDDYAERSGNYVPTPQDRFARDVDRLEEFHTSLHGQSAAEDNTCHMCRG